MSNTSNGPLRAGPEVGQATDPLALLRPEQFPGFMSAARVNNALNVLQSRGLVSPQFGCGRTHNWPVCGDNDFIAAGGPGCDLGQVYEVPGGYDRSQTFDVSVAGLLPTALTFTIDDPNGVGIGALLADWFLGGAANTLTSAPVPDSVVEIRTYDCVFSIAQWQITSLVEVTVGQTYDLVLNTTLLAPSAPLCTGFDTDTDDMAACLAALGVGTVSMSVHSQDPPRWGVVASVAQAPEKCSLEHQANVGFRPRLFYALRECADWLGEIDWPAAVRADALMSTNAELSRLLEIDDGRAQNPSLISAAQNITPGSGLGVPGPAVSVPRAFTLLLDAFAQVGSGYGSFHGASRALPWALWYNQVRLDGNVYRGPMRFPYNPGPGFVNAVPVVAGGAPDGSTIEPDDGAWLYGIVDSPVEYRVGETQVVDWTPANSGDHGRKNRTGARAEHKAIVRFNTCSVFAVRVCVADIEAITVPRA